MTQVSIVKAFFSAREHLDNHNLMLTFQGDKFVVCDTKKGNQVIESFDNIEEVEKFAMGYSLQVEKAFKEYGKKNDR